MIRTLIIALAFSTSLTAISSGPAFAQSTDQTDQSEEDWRKSRKKRSTTEVFEDILNSTNSGWGTTQGPMSPVDSLPEESRRHLMRERARMIAEADPGETPDAEYKPSEAAKTDADLEDQEKEAWDVIVTDMKGSGGQNGPQGQGGPNKVVVTGQGSGQGDQQGQRGNSSMRGGSSQSVAEIMAVIKGLKSGGGSASGNQGQGQSGQSPQGQSQQGDAQDTNPKQESGESQSASDQSSQSPSSSDTQSEAQADSQSQSDAGAQAAEQEQDEVKAQADAQSQAQTQPEPISPLERIKNSRERDSSGSRTSASDYMNKGQSD